MMGPSGEGKSTLLNILGGYLRPDTGEVTRGCSPEEISFILQSNEGLRSRTVLDNVAVPLLRRMRENAARSLSIEALAFLGIDDLAMQIFRNLSGGEAQRVSIARAIAGRAKALLADEPTAQLDLRNRMLVVDALRRSASVGTAVVIATHDRLVAAKCDRVFQLSEGILRLNDEGHAK